MGPDHVLIRYLDPQRTNDATGKNEIKILTKLASEPHQKS